MLALEICMKRSSVLTLYLLRRKCRPSAPPDVKFTLGRIGRHVNIAEQSSAADFGVRDNAAVSGEVPLQRDGVDPDSIGVSGALENHEDRHHVHRVFEAAL